MKKIFIILLCGLSFACSDDFLDKSPSINTDIEITEVEHLDRLLSGLGIDYVPDITNIWATDNAYIPQEILDETGNSTFTLENIDHYTFNTEINRSSDGLWSAHYTNLKIPNLIIDLMAKGELIGEDEVQKQEVVAEAHFRRAYHLFEAAVVYGLYPSTANADELGVVLKKTSSITESLKRATLKETFEFILSDLEEALKYPTMAKKTMFRIGKPSVHALAARVNLYLGNYDEAEAHATEALAGYSPMVNFESTIFELSYTLWYGPFVYPNTAELSTWTASIPELYTDEYFYVESTNGWWNTSPSKELMDLYDSKDLRNIFYIKDWFSRSGATVEPWYTYMNVNVGTTLGGPGVAEMYLTRAECKARKNDFAGAMSDVEMVRVNRFNAADYAALSIPTTAKDAVNEIVDERRREDPFEYRLMDMKRLNNDPLTDPIILTRVVNGETTVIQPDDRRYARPIGVEAIILSNGATQQNTY